MRVFRRNAPVPTSTAELGRRGERAAARWLRRERYRILARNVRIPGGELDLVCCAPDRRTIVVVEVKTRIAGASGPPPEANVGAEKRARLRRLAERLRRANGWEDRPIRIEVIAVEWGANGRPSVRRFQSIGC